MISKCNVGTTLQPTLATLETSFSPECPPLQKSNLTTPANPSAPSPALSYSEKESAGRRLVRLPKAILHKLTGGRIAQACLNRSAIISQRMMGIGAGAGVLNSGEAAVFPLLPRQSSEPLVVFDVGSNRGQFLNLARKSLAGKDFHIHCFEPGQKTFESLSSQATDSRVTLNNVAVGNCEESRTLYYDRCGSGMASLTKRELKHRGIQFDQFEEVSVTTIDRYCETHGIQGIDLLKLDIEGHELDALKGAEKTFSQNAIRLVTFEMGGCNIDTRTFFRDFWNFFTDQKMTLHRITPSGSLIEIRRYKETHEQFRTTNFVAIRRDR